MWLLFTYLLDHSIKLVYFIISKLIEDLECSLELGAEEPKSKLLAQFEIFQERLNRYERGEQRFDQVISAVLR